MSIFGAIGKGLKKGLGFVGDVAKKAAPVVGLIPGVGTVAGGIIGGAGSLASDVGHGKKVSLVNALKSGASGALSGFAGSKLLGGKGVSGLLGKLKGVTGGAPAPVDAMSEFGGSSGGGGGGIGGTLGSLFGHKAGIGDVAKLGLAGAGLYSSAKQQGKANEISDRLLAQEQAQDAARAPLRGLFMDQVQHLPNEPQDLTTLFRGSNPLRRAA